MDKPQSGKPAKQRILIGIDLKNAFNSLSRDLSTALIEKYFPQYLPFFLAVYGKAITVVSPLSETNFLMNEGGAQGDPVCQFYLVLF
jgi:hypothetical protein